jgi:hypothetical protein
MARTKPDNELVTWDCCGNRWEIILTRRHPEGDMFQPLCGGCGKKIAPVHGAAPRAARGQAALAALAPLSWGRRTTDTRGAMGTLLVPRTALIDSILSRRSSRPMA